MVHVLIRNWLLISVLGFFNFGCSIGVTRYDPVTYKNLTDLKPEVTMLYETLVTKNVDENKIYQCRLKLAQIYEYEVGKGSDNKDTTDIIQKIQRMYERDIDEWRDGGITAKDLSDIKGNIIQAFDKAILSERSKNKVVK